MICAYVTTGFPDRLLPSFSEDNPFLSDPVNFSVSETDMFLALPERCHQKQGGNAGVYKQQTERHKNGNNENEHPFSNPHRGEETHYGGKQLEV